MTKIRILVMFILRRWASIELFIYVFFINLALSIDNALAISQIISEIPEEKRKKTLFVGVTSAVLMRIGLTFVIFFLYKINLIRIFGGISLIIIAIYGIFKREKEINYKWGLYQILWFDLILSIDNLLALVGSAHGNFRDVFSNVLLSVPIVYGTAFGLSKFLNKFKFLKYIVSVLLTWVGTQMILK